MKLVTKLIADLIPGDKVHEVVDVPLGSLTRVTGRLPWTIVLAQPIPTAGSEGLIQLAYRVHRQRTKAHHQNSLPGHWKVRVQKRRVKSAVSEQVDGAREFYIRNNTTGEQLLVRERSKRAPSGERLFSIRWSKTASDAELWSDPYTETAFVATLGKNWSIQSDTPTGIDLHLFERHDPELGGPV